MSDRLAPSTLEAHLLADLNAQQREAVVHPSGPLLVVAGAGTGKTRVLTRRAGWLLTQGVPAWGVLAITFTNKSARVLRERLARIPGSEGIWAGTFHGFGAYLLRRHADAIGLDTQFTILDRDDQQRLLKGVLSDLGIGPSRIRPQAVAHMISQVKNGSGGPPTRLLGHDDAEALFGSLLKQYTARCRAASLLDFDDLLIESVRLLDEAPEIGDMYRQRFAHVLVDEYQDTNLVQRDLVLQLLGPARNLTVVGDPDQSIYRWRGANIANILGFAEDLPGARTVVLEQNYRSTQSILDCAEAVIARNVGRHAKRLFTENPEGGAVEVHRALDGEHEGQLVARRIAAWMERGRRPQDIGVIYRINALSRTVEIGLRSAGIPYHVVAGTEFFKRREVKDLLAYARLIANPNDDAAFLRIANVPKRGVGAGSLDKIRASAVQRGESVAAASRRADCGASGRARKGLKALHALLDEVRAMPARPVAPLLHALAKGSGYRRELEDSADEIERTRVENLDELIAFARQHDEDQIEGDLMAFLERTSLVSDQDGYEAEGGSVSLLSVHAAKGLEFPCVLIAGVEDAWFPHARSLDEAGGTEEERRLFYVAMTRAQDELVLTLAGSRQTYRGREPRRPSPYLRDLPRERVQAHDALSSYGRPLFDRPVAPSAGAWGGDDHVAEQPEGYEAVPDHDVPVVARAGVEGEQEGFVMGERVSHPYFGPGTLTEVQGTGASARVTVEFDGHGRKRLLLGHARLERRS